MVLSKAPNEILALGDHLVNELELADTHLTASRWMAHHLAALMVESRDSAADDRVTKQSQAADLILRLWAQRDSLPGRVSPLRKVEAPLALLRLLQAEASPFHRYENQPLSSLLAETFDAMRRVVGSGIVHTMSSPERLDVSEPIKPFLPDDEIRVLSALDQWVEHFKKLAAARAPRVVILRETSEADAAPDVASAEEATPQQVLVDAIDDAMRVLSKLRQQLAKGS